ncbi:hypothetical protein PIB30_088241 [Stylosanthes scabra]|uniref:Uncharacterized protein n=1 Tax=Stylosanthes scabra TaxID=79078 RepID=A0ABU6VVI6_9FABA|nr:hypothetical protein [Stylosanthes scabra]
MDAVNLDCLRPMDQVSEDPKQISQECNNVGVEPPYDDPRNPSSEPCPLNLSRMPLKEKRKTERRWWMKCSTLLVMDACRQSVEEEDPTAATMSKSDIVEEEECDDRSRRRMAAMISKEKKKNVADDACRRCLLEMRQSEWSERWFGWFRSGGGGYLR